jgi:hypothetical protein
LKNLLKAQNKLLCCHEEAQSGHNFVGTEQLLLGVMGQRDYGIRQEH